ncbi:MAG: hypothetical protein H6704_06430 [Myxococcales bacterium]|nr:hypothetical protein [Myxococcales bacterium]
MNGTLKRLALALTLGASATVAGPAAAQVSDPHKQVIQARQALDAWFAGYEFVPEKRHFDGLGVGLGPALAQIVGDADAPLLSRARALSAMVYAPGPETEGALLLIARGANQPSLLRRKAVLVLGESYGPKHLGEIVDVYSQSPDDVPLREACARAIRFAGDQGKVLRTMMLRVEQAPTVRALLHDDKQIGADR